MISKMRLSIERKEYSDNLRRKMKLELAMLDNNREVVRKRALRRNFNSEERKPTSINTMPLFEGSPRYS